MSQYYLHKVRRLFFGGFYYISRDYPPTETEVLEWERLEFEDESNEWRILNSRLYHPKSDDEESLPDIDGDAAQDNAIDGVEHEDAADDQGDDDQGDDNKDKNQETQ